MTEPTTERLAKSLEAVKAPKWMIKKAREGYYDDYKSPLATPLIQLMQDARSVGLPDKWRQKIVDGEFDATKEEGEAWAASPDGQETFRKLISGE